MQCKIGNSEIFCIHCKMECFCSENMLSWVIEKVSYSQNCIFYLLPPIAHFITFCPAHLSHVILQKMTNYGIAETNLFVFFAANLAVCANQVTSKNPERARNHNFNYCPYSSLRTNTYVLTNNSDIIRTPSDTRQGKTELQEKWTRKIFECDIT